MKSFRRILSAAFFSLIILGSFTEAQTVYFCEGVDDDGGYLYILTRLGYACDTYEIVIDIFKVDRRGNEDFYNTYYIDTSPDWYWFWKKVTFYDRGTYRVYIYDEYSQRLASGEVDINF